jgi:PAS domain S-box-containing protein
VTAWLAKDGSILEEGMMSGSDETQSSDALSTENASMMRRVLGNLPGAVGVCRLDSDARILFINPAFTRIFGYSASDIPTVLVWAGLAYPDPTYRHVCAGWWNEAVARARSSDGLIPSKEFQVTSKDGNVLDVDISGSVVDELLIVSFVDMTESKRTDAALRSAQDELARTAYEITENIPVGTYTMVLAPGDSMARFSFMSRRFLEITGLDREEAASDPLKGFACVHPDDFAAWVEVNAVAFARKTPFAAETRLIVRDQVRWVRAESVPRERADGSTIWEGVLTDITERKQAVE